MSYASVVRQAPRDPPQRGPPQHGPMRRDTGVHRDAGVHRDGVHHRGNHGRDHHRGGYNPHRAGDGQGHRGPPRHDGGRYASNYDPSEAGSDDTPILFPCVECKGRLPTKVVNGQIVKRYDDDTCAHCWAANDIIAHPTKYGFTDGLHRFLTYIDPSEVLLLLEHPEHTLAADIFTGLHHFCDFDDPVADYHHLIAFLDPIKAYNHPLLVRLHKRINDGDQWWLRDAPMPIAVPPRR